MIYMPSGIVLTFNVLAYFLEAMVLPVALSKRMYSATSVDGISGRVRLLPALRIRS